MMVTNSVLTVILCTALLLGLAAGQSKQRAKKRSGNLAAEPVQTAPPSQQPLHSNQPTSGINEAVGVPEQAKIKPGDQSIQAHPSGIPRSQWAIGQRASNQAHRPQPNPNARHLSPAGSQTNPPTTTAPSSPAAAVPDILHAVANLIDPRPPATAAPSSQVTQTKLPIASGGSQQQQTHPATGHGQQSNKQQTTEQAGHSLPVAHNAREQQGNQQSPRQRESQLNQSILSLASAKNPLHQVPVESPSTPAAKAVPGTTGPSPVVSRFVPAIEAQPRPAEPAVHAATVSQPAGIHSQGAATGGALLKPLQQQPLGHSTIPPSLVQPLQKPQTPQKAKIGGATATKPQALVKPQLPAKAAAAKQQTGSHKATVAAVKRTPTVCKTPACVALAKEYKKSMNLKADPCENFYDYVCGAYAKDHSIAEKLVTSAVEDPGRDHERIKRFLETNSTLPIGQSKTVAFVKTFYKDCTRSGSSASRDFADVLKIIGLSGWPLIRKPVNITAVLVALQQHFGLNPFWSFRLGTDPTTLKPVIRVEANLAVSPWKDTYVVDEQNNGDGEQQSKGGGEREQQQNPPMEGGQQAKGDRRKRDVIMGDTASRSQLLLNIANDVLRASRGSVMTSQEWREAARNFNGPIVSLPDLPAPGLALRPECCNRSSTRTISPKRHSSNSACFQRNNQNGNNNDGSNDDRFNDCVANCRDDGQDKPNCEKRCSGQTSALQDEDLWTLDEMNRKLKGVDWRKLFAAMIPSHLAARINLDKLLVQVAGSATFKQIAQILSTTDNQNIAAYIGAYLIQETMQAYVTSTMQNLFYQDNFSNYQPPENNNNRNRNNGGGEEDDKEEQQQQQRHDGNDDCVENCIDDGPSGLSREGCEKRCDGQNSKPRSSGQPFVLPTWRKCVVFLQDLLPKATSAIRTSVVFPGPTKTKALKMFETLKATFIKMINGYAWLSPKGKQSRIAKIQKLVPQIDDPTERSAKSLDVFYANLLSRLPALGPKPHMFQMMTAIRLFNQTKLFEQLLQPAVANKQVAQPQAPAALPGGEPPHNDDDEQEHKPDTTNPDNRLSYNCQTNIMSLGDSSLQVPMFHPDYPPSVNYGGAAVEIAERLFRNDCLWPSGDSEDGFPAKCTLYLRGPKNDTTDKSADFWYATGSSVLAQEALTLALRAYWQSVRVTPTETSLHGMTAKESQLFYISYAQVFCDRNGNNSQRALDLYRKLAYFEGGFGRAFRCPVGSLMNPTTKLRWQTRFGGCSQQPAFDGGENNGDGEAEEPGEPCEPGRC